jgi:hypothetical protein
LERPSWHCGLDFNGGRDDLEFTLVHGGKVELCEDVVVRFAVDGCFGVVASWWRKCCCWNVLWCRGCRRREKWRLPVRLGVGDVSVS